MTYPYEDLSPEQFEDLVVAICRHLFGEGIQPFAKGKDGGRDARFEGTAEAYPSRTGPWKGITVVQAKHTNGICKAFGEGDFFKRKAKKSVLGEELPRIKRLRRGKSLDHYILFSNRRLGAIANETLKNVISKESGIPTSSIALCGIEQLDLWLKLHPEALDAAGLDPVDSPLMVSPGDLADVVESLAKRMKAAARAVARSPIARVSYEKKNQLNNMSADFESQMRRRFLKETYEIGEILSATGNEDLQQRYQAVVDEFQMSILAKRKDHQSFEAMLNYLRDLLFKRDPILRAHKTLTMAMLFYMYWHCDIGLAEHD